MGNNNGNDGGQWRWRLQLPTVAEMAITNGEGNGNRNGWQWCKRDGGGDEQGRLHQQWPTATAMAIGYRDVDSNGDIDGNGDSDSNCNGKGQFDGNNSSCAGNVQRCGRGNTLPPPPWTQRKVHSPALRHGGSTAKSVCSLWKGRVPDSLPRLIFLYIFSATVQFTKQPSVCPPYHSGAQEPFLPIDTLPPPLLQEPCQPIDNLPRIILHFFVKVNPGRACIDYYVPFLCWCEMTNLPSTSFISQIFPLSLTEHTKFIWKHPVVIVETFKSKSISQFQGIILHNPFSGSWCLHLLGNLFL